MRIKILRKSISLTAAEHEIEIDSMNVVSHKLLLALAQKLRHKAIVAISRRNLSRTRERSAESISSIEEINLHPESHVQYQNMGDLHNYLALLSFSDISSLSRDRELGFRSW